MLIPCLSFLTPEHGRKVLDVPPNSPRSTHRGTCLPRRQDHGRLACQGPFALAVQPSGTSPDVPSPAPQGIKGHRGRKGRNEGGWRGSPTMKVVVFVRRRPNSGHRRPRSQGLLISGSLVRAQVRPPCFLNDCGRLAALPLSSSAAAVVRSSVLLAVPANGHRPCRHCP
jgi:hypothetical protein